MRGPRRRRRLAAAALNELSSEEDTGNSDSEQEPGASAEGDEVSHINHVAANSTGNNRNPIVPHLMRPDTSTSSSNSSDVEEGRSASVAASSLEMPTGGNLQNDNGDERDLSQEEMDKLVQLQDLTGNHIPHQHCLKAFNLHRKNILAGQKLIK